MPPHNGVKHEIKWSILLEVREEEDGVVGEAAAEMACEGVVGHDTVEGKVDIHTNVAPAKMDHVLMITASSLTKASSEDE